MSVGDTSLVGEYIIYNNIGTYMGETISLRITITGYQVSENITSTGVSSEPFIYFALDTIGGYFCWCDYVDFRMEYLDEDGNVVDISSYLTFSDIDARQSVRFLDESQIDTILLADNTTISLWEMDNHYYE